MADPVGGGGGVGAGRGAGRVGDEALATRAQVDGGQLSGQGVEGGFYERRMEGPVDPQQLAANALAAELGHQRLEGAGRTRHHRLGGGVDGGDGEVGRVIAAGGGDDGAGGGDGGHGPGRAQLGHEAPPGRDQAGAVEGGQHPGQGGGGVGTYAVAHDHGRFDPGLPPPGGQAQGQGVAGRLGHLGAGQGLLGGGPASRWRPGGTGRAGRGPRPVRR